MSINGASTDVGTGPAGVGDFTRLMLDINPNLTTAGYPNMWTLFNVDVTGVPSPVTGRFAFRYYVENGGPNGTNSDYIGIDTVTYYCVVPTPTPTPSGTATPSSAPDHTSTAQKEADSRPVPTPTTLTVDPTRSSLNSQAKPTSVPSPGKRDR